MNKLTFYVFFFSLFITAFLGNQLTALPSSRNVRPSRRSQTQSQGSPSQEVPFAKRLEGVQVMKDPVTGQKGLRYENEGSKIFPMSSATLKLAPLFIEDYVQLYQKLYTQEELQQMSEPYPMGGRFVRFPNGKRFPLNRFKSAQNIPDPTSEKPLEEGSATNTEGENRDTNKPMTNKGTLAKLAKSAEETMDNTSSEETLKNDEDIITENYSELLGNIPTQEKVMENKQTISDENTMAEAFSQLPTDVLSVESTEGSQPTSESTEVLPEP